LKDSVPITRENIIYMFNIIQYFILILLPVVVINFTPFGISSFDKISGLPLIHSTLFDIISFSKLLHINTVLLFNNGKNNSLKLGSHVI
jgi:hypothetical protein